MARKTKSDTRTEKTPFQASKRSTRVAGKRKSVCEKEAASKTSGRKKAVSKKTTPKRAAQSIARVFGQEDQIVLSQNEFFRFAPNPTKVGHAVIRLLDDGGRQVLQATQYPAPIQKDSDRTIPVPDEFAPPPLIRPLQHIEKINRFGQERFRARTPDTGTAMFATRTEALEIDGEEATLAFFSPLPPNSKGSEPFWGSERVIPFFKPELTPRQQQACLRPPTDCKTLDDSVHKRRETAIDYPSVHTREGEKRSMSQNKVMGERSARDTFEDFAHQHEAVMNPELLKIVKGSYDAPLRDAWGSQKRPEWLHINAHSLMKSSDDPQVPENLGAAPKWANSKMMIPERAAKWYAFNRPDSTVKLSGDFTMLHGTDIAADIDFNVTFTEGGKTVQMQQHLNPLAPYPIYATGSDIAQATLVTHSIHQAVAPMISDITTETPKAAKAVTAGDLRQTVFPSKAYLDGPSAAAWASSLPKNTPLVLKKDRVMIPESMDVENYLANPNPGVFSQFGGMHRKRDHRLYKHHPQDAVHPAVAHRVSRQVSAEYTPAQPVLPVPRAF